jgi:membrane-associated phospholipid phosphatase
MSLKSALPSPVFRPGRCGRSLTLRLLLLVAPPLLAEARDLTSGHPDRVALLLAELFPEPKQAILAIGRDIGWDRVLIGKHFPTGIYAGRVLGQAIVRQLLSSPAFHRYLA